MWLLTPAAPENPLSWKKKAFSYPDRLAETLRVSIQLFQSILPNTLTGKQIQRVHREWANVITTPQKTHFYWVGGRSTYFFSSLPQLLFMLFQFSTQLVFTAAKCPTKPDDFSASLDQLVSPLGCLFLTRSCEPYTLYMGSIQPNPNDADN